jgi:hypothetical protein
VIDVQAPRAEENSAGLGGRGTMETWRHVRPERWHCSRTTPNCWNPATPQLAGEVDCMDLSLDLEVFHHKIVNSVTE